MKLPAPLTSSQKPEFYGHRTSPMSTVLTLYRSACSWGLHIGDGLNHLKYQLLFICDHRSHSLLPSGILLFSFLGIHVRLIGNPVQFSEDTFIPDTKLQSCRIGRSNRRKAPRNAEPELRHLQYHSGTASDSRFVVGPPSTQKFLNRHAGILAIALTISVI